MSHSPLAYIVFDRNEISVIILNITFRISNVNDMTIFAFEYVATTTSAAAADDAATAAATPVTALKL